MPELTFTDERDARRARRALIDQGRAVTLLAHDPDRDLYVFDLTEAATRTRGATMTDPDRDRLIASMLANSGDSAEDIAAELEMDVKDVRDAARRGARTRSWND